MTKATTVVHSPTAARCVGAYSSSVDTTTTSRQGGLATALGWPLPTLALRLDRSPGNLRRTLSAATVTVATARTIAALYNTLHDTTPPTRTPAEQAAATDTREQARLHGWLPPLAWDDIDTDVDSDDLHAIDGEDLNVNDSWVDEIAVERAMNGDHIRLTRPERDEAIARLTGRGISARRIAELLRTSSRNVVRRRRAQRAAKAGPELNEPSPISVAIRRHDSDRSRHAER